MTEKNRIDLQEWQNDLKQNTYLMDKDFIHTIQYVLPKHFSTLDPQLEKFGEVITTQLENYVAENHTQRPELKAYNGIGERVDEIIHHPAYRKAGNLIYQTGLLKKFASPGELSLGLAFLFLSSHVGEAGHNCPIACSAGVLRIMQKIPDFPNKKTLMEKLTLPSFDANFTGAQFLTEVQGGSDVGLNAVLAKRDPEQKDIWRIHGEKWFCSNINAELILMTARFDENIKGTKGLALFFVPAIWKDKKNHFTIRRLKQKLGTRTLATAEVDFHGAYAYLVGSLDEGFKLVMENVLHLSRIFNSFCVLGMARSAYKIARAYAEHRHAFGKAIIHYPLVKENLARIKAENSAMLASLFATTRLQDEVDVETHSSPDKLLLLRLLVNLQKYLTALWSVEHIHHALDVLAGNGTIETFSAIPRLLTDCIICENWEGTHNTLRMQILRDILKYNIDQIFISYLQTALKKLTDPNELDTFHQALNALKAELETLRTLDPELQTLQIRLIVDRMAIIYCGLQFLFEAKDQMQQTKSHSKLACFQYFSLLHFQNEKIKFDKYYLDLINQII